MSEGGSFGEAIPSNQKIASLSAHFLSFVRNDANAVCLLLFSLLLNVDKASLRKLYLEKRSRFIPSELEGASEKIAAHFTEIPLKGVQYIHTFYPIVGKFEVDSLRIADWLWKNHPEIKLVLSQTNYSDCSLTHYLWEENTPLAMNSRGITEPENGEIVSPELLDIVLVPLLVVDKQGNRAGYGKGFYDRFLVQCRPDVQKIGLSYFEPVDNISDVNEYDIPLNACITPKKIWQFKSA